jgi:hypothetical protein
MRKLYRVHCGKGPHNFHSYRDLPDLDHALAYLWAMAHSPAPETCWYWQGMDGWMSNKHMAGKSFPSRLADLCEFYLEEDQKLFTKEMENA